MRLIELFEAANNEVAIIFGRFNPPHKGHKAAWEIASQSPVWYVGTNKSTQGPKDPLPFEVKVEAMKTVWPEVENHIIAETSWLTLASLVYKKHGDVSLKVLTDEDWVTKTLVQYNGKEGPHGVYKFSNIEQTSTPRLSSATALRAAVEAGDRDAFTKAAGVDAETPVAGKPFFDLVAEYLLPYAEKEKAKAAKKKVKAPAEGVDEGWKSKVAGAALAAANLLGSPAQAAEEPVKPITIATVIIDGEVRRYNLGDKFSNAREAEEFITNVLNKQGLQGYQLEIKHGYPKKKEVKEAPIEMDPADPMDPMIYSHDKANPAKLKYRMLRASNQIKDLASRVDNASPAEWQTMTKQFDELKMNVEQIRHALEELAKIRRKGGVRSRGIDPMIDSVDEHIVKVKGGYELKSKHGNKNLGKYPTRAGAEKRERQVQYFKHAGK